MEIDDYMKMSRRRMPKLGRVVEIDLRVQRCGIGSGGGVIYDRDAVVKRKVRRVLDANGWRWQLVRSILDQELWDYYFEYDKEQLADLNYELGLLK